MQKSTITTFLITLGILIFCTAAFAWLATTIYQTSKRLTTVLQTLNNDQVMASDQQVLADLLESTQADRLELNSYVVEGENGTIALLSQVDALALALTIKLETNKLDVVPAGRKPYDALQVMYNFSGTEAAVQSFVVALENIPYTSSLTAIELTKRPATTEGPASISGSVTLLLTMVKL